MMSDQMMRRLKVHLTTTMDSVLRTAVFEVMKIFEKALCDHHMEMTLKGEEVAQLEMKLQAAELKLKDLQSECPRSVNIKQTQTEPEVVLDAPGPTSEVSEVVHEVPDDWCAPLGCELVTKEDEDVCPSVRLRAFSIPLRHIPVRQHEVHDSDNNLQSTSQGRRSRRISALNERGKLPACVQEGRSGPIRNDVKVLLQGKKRENQNALESFGKTKRRVNVTAKEPENTEKPKEDQRKSTAGKSDSPEAERVENAKKNKFHCSVCKRVFCTELGRNEHELFHKTCRGCKQVFRYNRFCRLHKLRCDKYLLSVKQASALKKSSREEKSAPAPYKDVNVNEESLLHSPGNDGERATKNYSCTYCNCKFDLRSKLAKHVSHAHEKPFICNMCPMKFQLSQALSVHMTKKHKKLVNSVDVNVDLGWTKPLEGINVNGKDSVSPSKDPAKI